MDLISMVLWLFIFLVSVALLYDRATKGIPSRLRADQAPKSEVGIVQVDGFGSSPGSQLDPNGLDIIFVHGLGSNPDTTWRARKDLTTSLTGSPAVESDPSAHGNICWITDFLPKDLDLASRGTIRVFFYNHDSYWQRDAIQTRLWTLGNNLLHRISSGIRVTEEERSRGLVFVGYSYGGLIIKQALIQASKSRLFAEIAEHTKAALFLGTPHRGSSFTKWGGVIARALQPLGSNPSILGELAYDSVSLLDLHKDFVAITDGLRVINFFEERKTSILKVWFVRWAEFCVREQSATFEGPQVQNIGLGVDHYGLNKFGSRTSIYKVILSKLLELILSTSSISQPGLYSVPLETVHSYTERRNLSLGIAEKLRKPCDKSSLHGALAIYGLGGTGKTQLALKFIEDHKDRYNPILWIDAKSSETARSSFGRCTGELRLSVDEALAQVSALEDSLTVQAVLRWLRDRNESHDEWLVIIDNADEFAWNINRIIPKGRRGNVIVTSRDDQSSRLFNGGCEKLCVYTMKPLEARTLLLKHLDGDSSLVSDNIQDVSNMIVHRLGYLALAVDLAGAYIYEDCVKKDHNQEAALKRYLADYGRHQDALLRSNYFSGLSSYDKTVWTVWDTTLETIERRYPEIRAGLLLAFLARFNGGIIQNRLFHLASLGFFTVAEKLCHQGQDLPDWLKELMEVAGQDWDSFRYQEALKLLERYSLLQQVHGEWPGVAMHSLVQWRATEYKKDLAWDLWYLIFISAVSYRVSQEEAKPQFRRHMITHLPAVGRSYLDNMQIDEQGKIFVWTTMGEVYKEEGRWNKAEELFLQAMETSLRVLGEEHPSTLTSMANLASTFWNQGRWKEAEKLQMQVMKTSLRVLGEEHPSTLIRMANLASIFTDQGRWNEAEELSVQVIKTGSRVLGEEHPSMLIRMTNLALTFWKQGRWKEAEELNVQVMKTSSRVLGEEHPSTLIRMANLASIFTEQGRWNEAEELSVQVIKTSSRVLGEEHPSTLIRMANLAHTYKAQNHTDKAIELMKKVNELRSKVIGANHPDTVASINDWESWVNI